MAVSSVSIDLGWLVGWLGGGWVGWLGRRETGGRRQLVVHQPQLFHHFSKHIWARTYLAKCKIGRRMSLNILAETTLPLIWGVWSPISAGAHDCDFEENPTTINLPNNTLFALVSHMMGLLSIFMPSLK